MSTLTNQSDTCEKATTTSSIISQKGKRVEISKVFDHDSMKIINYIVGISCC